MNTKHIHFIGIGGIGMSALALIARETGSIVSGCDTNVTQRTIVNLIKKDCMIASKHCSTDCFDPSITLMVYSTGTQQHLTEKIAAQNRNIPVIHRAALLAHFMRNKLGIAITGAHGKTTTSALVSHIFLSLGLNPTCVIGGIVPSMQSNAIYGSGKFFITEADESDRSFIQLPAAIKLVTNIDFEHVETYTSIDDIKNTYLTFLHAFQEVASTHVLCIDDYHIQSLLPYVTIPFKTYGVSEKADLRIINIELLPFSSHFTVYCKKSNQSVNCTVPIPGMHNILNATGALLTAHIAGIDLIKAALTLHTFQGVDRRFSIRGRYNNALVIDDYAHHPEEIRKTIIAAKNCTPGKLYVVYQPHRFTRTVGLWNDFVHLWQTDNMVDHIFITDIYGAGEQMTVPVSSKQLVNAINKSTCQYITNNTHSIQKAFVDMALTSNDIILFVGAGDISLQSISLVKNDHHSLLNHQEQPYHSDLSLK